MNNLYEVDLLYNTETTNHANIAYICNSKEHLELWHRRLGHRNHVSIKTIVKNQLPEGLKINCKRYSKYASRQKQATRYTQNWQKSNK